MLRKHLSDFTDADMLARPVPGANHAAWQVSHLVNSTYNMVKALVPSLAVSLPAKVEGVGKSLAVVDDPARFATALAPAIAARGPALVVMTRGAAGAIAVPRCGVAVAQAGIAVDTVDALGAGDAFAATLGVALARRHSLADAMLHAAAAGALTTTRHGVFDALPGPEAIAELLARRRLTPESRL